MRALARYWPRRVAAAEPLAAALMDHYRTGRSRKVQATRADGVHFEIDTDEYFILDGQLAPLDELALDRCRGRVLDVGAGAGRHALALQERGLEVVAIDVSPICTQLCRLRGVADARTFDALGLGKAGPSEEAARDEQDPALGRFDTIFFGMQTIGVAGGAWALSRLLERLRDVLAPGGQILADSSALREAWEGDVEDTAPSRGEIVLSMRYRGWLGEAFPWVYFSEEDLARTAADAGYETEILGRVDAGEFLACLQPGAEGTG